MLALAIAIAFSPLPELQAASLLSPSSQPGSDDLSTQAKMKKKGYKKRKKGKKKRGKKRKGKRAKSKAGKCGTYMYFSKKQKKCLDARNKK
jgi:hypothetical protein